MIKPNISFNDFMKTDIRVGKIIEAEAVKDSNKLLKLIIDFGDFKRQLIAGIGDVYLPQEIIGLTIPVLVNLEPKEIFGYESQGMILAVGDNKVSSLLTTDKETNVGESVH
jgi:methionine--tRNA ligase beta chain